MKFLSLAVLALGLVTNAFAGGKESQSIPFAAFNAKQKLVTVTKVSDGSKVDVGVLTANALVGMFVTQPNAADLTFSLAQIAHPDGVVLNRTSGYNVLILQGSVDMRLQEGTLTLKYLTNGLLGQYKSCLFNLRKDATGFYIENYYTHQKPVTQIRVHTNALGVTNLEGVCPVQQRRRR